MNPLPLNRLQRERQRLFDVTPPAAGIDPAGQPTVQHRVGLDDQGRVRALVLALGRPADWATLSPLWRGVQADWQWPAPAIVVNGVDAFELWFSLQVPLPCEQAAALLQALCQRYLPAIRPERLQTWPDATSLLHMPELPPRAVAPGRWAAFVAPDLPAVFQDDPSLDFEPGADAQAELLSHLRPVSPEQLSEAMDALAALAAAPEINAPTEPALGAGAFERPAKATQSTAPTPPSLVGPFTDPKAFLHAVMNEPAAPLGLRVEAAKALLGALTSPQD